MKSTRNLKTLSLAVAGALALALAACNPGSLPGNVSGLPDGAGSQQASITGSVVKSDNSTAQNATMVIIQRVNGADRDVQIVRTDSNGQFRFSGIPAGEYRLAFVLQSESERKEGATKYYDPVADLQTAQYFSFITTGNFNYDGNSSTSFQVPQLNVGWVSNLDPHNETVDADESIAFNWSPVDGATSYIVDIRDSNNNPFYKSPAVTTNRFIWSDLRGNQGSNSGQEVRPGQTYYYIVNATLSRANTGDGPTPTYGGTALAKFTTN
ncbi:MAG: carboxypeptidase-like regulatory domain-containing protein [Candidatus Sericytochromatia bacterium]